MSDKYYNLYLRHLRILPRYMMFSTGCLYFTALKTLAVENNNIISSYQAILTISTSPLNPPQEEGAPPSCPLDEGSLADGNCSLFM